MISPLSRAIEIKNLLNKNLFFCEHNIFSFNLYSMYQTVKSMMKFYIVL